MITGAEVRVMMGISSNARNQEKHTECTLSNCWQEEHGLLISRGFYPQWNTITFCHFKLSWVWHFAIAPLRNCWDSGFIAPDITHWQIIRCLFSEIVDIVVVRWFDIHKGDFITLSACAGKNSSSKGVCHPRDSYLIAGQSLFTVCLLNSPPSVHTAWPQHPRARLPC